MIDPDHPKLSISRQCELLDISRETYYYRQRESRAEADLADLKRIMEVLRELPFYGYRRISRVLMGMHPHLRRSCGFQNRPGKRVHQSVDYQTPDQMYESFVAQTNLPSVA